MTPRTVDASSLAVENLSTFARALRKSWIERASASAGAATPSHVEMLNLIARAAGHPIPMSRR